MIKSSEGLIHNFGDKMSTIDIHTHILPQHLPKMKELSGYSGWIELKNSDDSSTATMVKDTGEFFRTVHQNLWSLETRMKDMDRTGVALQILSTVPVMFNYWAEDKHALHLSRYLNDHIAACVQKHPTRFAGLATVPMQNPELAAEELKRCVLDLKLKGIQIGSHINQYNLDAPQLDIIYKTAQDLDCAILVHPWDMECGGRMSNFWLPWLVGMPSETTVAICSTVFGGVFDRFPNLRVCFCHGGGSFPFTLGRISHGYDVRPDLCAKVINNNPRAYLHKIHVDSLVHDSSALKYLIDVMGENNVMVGSDYPFPLGEPNPGSEVLGQPSFTDPLKKKLVAENALKFFQIDPQIFTS